MKPLGYIPRLISTHIQKLMEMYPVVTIAGPRQSGMTFTPAMVKNVEKFAKFVPDSLPPALIYAGADMGMFHNVQICNFTHYNNIFCET